MSETRWVETALTCSSLDTLVIDNCFFINLYPFLYWVRSYYLAMTGDFIAPRIYRTFNMYKVIIILPKPKNYNQNNN